jgi:hypothetical protein
MRALALLALLALVACTDDTSSPSGAGASGGAGATGGAGGSDGGTGGTPTAGGGGAGGAGPDTVPMFVAEGHMGRTTISCDGGHTWVANRSDDDALVCWPPPDQIPDCDHNASAGRGIGFGPNGFVATFGWGDPGSLRLSTDGVAWAEVQQGETFGGVAYGSGVYLAAGYTPWRSPDGSSWTALGPAGISQPVRRFGFVAHDGGRFLLVAEGGGQVELAVSADGGGSWTFPSWPAGCGQSIQTEGGIAYGNGVAVVLGGNGLACASSDGGDSWTSTPVAGQIDSHLVWNGAEFFAWASGTAYHSSDGTSWTSTPITPASIDIGPAAAADDGTIVAVRGGWQVWYDEQEFYRSDDGLAWEVLDPSAFVGSHPIRAITFGHGAPSAECPLR